MFFRNTHTTASEIYMSVVVFYIYKYCMGKFVFHTLSTSVNLSTVTEKSFNVLLSDETD